MNSAGNGSGTVAVRLNSPDITDFEDLKPLTTADDSPKRNTNVSVPAGDSTEEEYLLRFIYTPAGEITGGVLDIRIPLSKGWAWTEAISEYLNDSWNGGIEPGDVSVSDDGILTATFPEGFGAVKGDDLELTLQIETAPNSHGNQKFTARSKKKNVDGSSIWGVNLRSLLATRYLKTIR